jgi:hypothetical protein
MMQVACFRSGDRVQDGQLPRFCSRLWVHGTPRAGEFQADISGFSPGPTMGALKVAPASSSCRAYNNRGVAWRDEGGIARARADFQTALVMDPTLNVATEHLAGVGRQAVMASARARKGPAVRQQR